MTGAEFWAVMGGSGFVILLLSLIKIKPLEISVWHWLARKFGKVLNGETNDRLDRIETTLDAHLKEEEAREIIMYRQSILRFADEMYQKKFHSKESFEDVLSQIKAYNEYCGKHPDFENDRTKIAQKLIKEQYEECMKRNSFEIHAKEEKR